MLPHSSFLLVTVWLLGLTLRANPAISIGPKSILPSGGSVDILFTAADQPVSGIQFDIQYPSQNLQLTVSGGSAASSAGKTVYSSNPQPDVLRVLIVGMNQTPVASGVIATLSVQVNGPVGTYSLMILNQGASDPDGASLVPLDATNGTVTVTTSPSGPVIATITNAASYASGGVAPGEIVTIFGNLLGPATGISSQPTAGMVPTTVSGTRVLFGGTAAPIIYTSEHQVSAVAPYGLDGQTKTSVQVEYQGIQSAPVSVPVMNAIPGILTLDSSGQGQGAIVNADGQQNGPNNPAAAGSTVSIYGTGDGQTLPAGIDGAITPLSLSSLHFTVLSVSASIGGQNAAVTYTGSAPGYVAGLFQANVTVPAGVTSGSLPVTLTIGNSVSQTGVTIAVR